jgi:hypothetical protein
VGKPQPTRRKCYCSGGEGAGPANSSEHDPCPTSGKATLIRPHDTAQSRALQPRSLAALGDHSTRSLSLESTHLAHSCSHSTLLTGALLSVKESAVASTRSTVFIRDALPRLMPRQCTLWFWTCAKVRTRNLQPGRPQACRPTGPGNSQPQLHRYALSYVTTGPSVCGTVYEAKTMAKNMGDCD